MASECVDRSGPSRNLTTMRHTARDEVLLACLHRNPFPVNDQRVTALHNHHIFVLVMDMFHGGRGFTASPERHLASVGSIEYVTLGAGRGLIGAGDPVGGVLHKFRKGVHGMGY
jgi:hypothetical protein